VKTDSKGDQVWNKGYDLMNLQGYKITIIQTNDGGFALAGTQNSDFCLFKIKASNQFEWSKIYGDQETDTPCGLVQLEDGGYAMAGTWMPENTASTRNTLGLIRTDSSGSISWTKTFSAKEESSTSTYSNDQAFGMVRTSDGAYVLVGSTFFGSETHQDVFLVKTETMEQTPQTTPIPTPASSEASTTDNGGQTAQPSSSPTQGESTLTPSNTDTDGTSEDNIEGVSLDNPVIIMVVVLIVVVSAAVLGLVKFKRK
jgi:hypothetical protein